MMYAIVYQHQYGVDVAIADDEESAYKQAEKLVRAWRDDFNVPEEMSDGDALQNWYELTAAREFIEVTPAFHVDDFKEPEKDENPTVDSVA
jgi:hypothetical protein